MIFHVAIALALGQEVKVSLDERRAAVQHERDLVDLHLVFGELRAAGEGGQIVGNGFWRVVHDLADLRGGFALQGQLDDLDAMREHRTDVAEGTSHWDQDVGVGFSDRFQVSGDGARGHEKDTVGEVLGGEEGTLAESLLAKVENSRPAKCGWPAVMKRKVIDVAAM